MKKLLTSLIVLLAIGVIAFFVISNSPSSLTGGTVADNSQNENLKILVITGENFKFVVNGIDNPEIRVKKGDRVRIEFMSTSGFHDWVVDEFNAATKQVNSGGSTSVEFVADKRGTFEYYCSVGQHRANGMKGSLIVE